jgi:hypothetical protein
MLARAALAAALLAVAAPSAAPAAVTTFGSDLSAPALLDTVSNVLPSNHLGVDTALWDVTLANGASPASPANGQITDAKIRGCTNLSAGARPDMNRGGTEFHLQVLVPQPDGSLRVSITSQPFSLPACDATGRDLVTSFAPTSFCIHQGDYVAFNDEGGYAAGTYPNGVPYQVIGRVPNSLMDSFIRAGGTMNGSTLSPNDTKPSDGFAQNPGEELLLQSTLATGPDATPLCPGGTKGQQTGGGPGGGQKPAPKPTAPITLHTQKVGVNRRRVAVVAIFCKQKTPCTGTAKIIRRAGKAAAVAAKPLGSARFTIPARTTSKVKIRLTPKALRLLRASHRKLPATLSVVVAGQTFSAPITLKI